MKTGVQDSRENREPVFKMVPPVEPGDYDWIPAFAGMTITGPLRLFTSSSKLGFSIFNAERMAKKILGISRPEELCGKDG